MMHQMRLVCNVFVHSLPLKPVMINKGEYYIQ